MLQCNGIGRTRSIASTAGEGRCGTGNTLKKKHRKCLYQAHASGTGNRVMPAAQEEIERGSDARWGVRVAWRSAGEWIDAW